MKTNFFEHIFRANISNMKSYIPGEQPQKNSFVKLNTNENPYPPSKSILNRLREACTEELRLYPDPNATRLRNLLSKTFDKKPEQFIVGNGSDELLTILIRSFVGENDRIAYAYPTYGYYQPLIDVQGAKAVVTEYPDDFSLPAELADADARLTFLVNPNSPSGTLLPVEILEDLASRINGVLAIDEAYVDFSTGGAMGLVEKHINVVIVRTMSKSFSLAGMRVGFACANTELINGMLKVKDHYNVNRLSLVAAEAALEDIASMRKNASRISQTRERLINDLRDLDLYVWESATNFVLVRSLNVPAKTLYSELKERGVLVRYFDQPRLDDCLRITVGTDDETEFLLGQLRLILKD
ncbi:MAG: histidinol-phosphate transaminase [Candidatus Latescibacterota bacterium]|nr:histidinol-phosphate transaminase [Candidatus Latescibacterota bacterium]